MTAAAGGAALVLTTESFFATTPVPEIVVLVCGNPGLASKAAAAGSPAPATLSGIPRAAGVAARTGSGSGAGFVGGWSASLAADAGSPLVAWLAIQSRLAAVMEAPLAVTPVSSPLDAAASPAREVNTTLATLG